MCLEIQGIIHYLPRRPIYYVHLVDSREVTESHEKLYLTCMVLDVLNFQTPQDSSSAQTFNGTCKVLDETEVQAFILENVDLNDDDDSNLDNILKALSQIGGGFRVRAFKLYSTDFGIRSVAADFSSSASPRSHREKRPWRKLSRCCEVFVSKGKHPILVKLGGAKVNFQKNQKEFQWRCDM